MSPAIRKLLQLLTELECIADQTPPTEHRTRYGNPAFRTWMATMEEAAPRLLEPLTQEVSEGAGQSARDCLPELQSYLVDSFGNATRIDYGTGAAVEGAGMVCGDCMEENFTQAPG